ncbi:putative ionotropic glutamate receptor [Helianthus annuus]|nr:putative ionotropic glutamate receptor [Helianthus annuus]KAJ0488454.1 putative ionotropic glutamate receptor [Helianthus annuus]KAJ0491950.1 putative ionotropic glutamate receptor [Helianthus annuus]KAJ0491951.1 putative ionotropic glutamate receptor [Helianthus annuus]KAJ0673996.1 putative ionotropic glutamate receptor [Helianthus annuus]
MIHFIPLSIPLPRPFHSLIYSITPYQTDPKFVLSVLVITLSFKLISNLSRFVVIVWVFVVLVLTSSYTASLTSMLTVQQLRPTYTGISEIKRKGESIGYQEGSFVRDMLKDMGFIDTQLKSYNSFEEYHDALELGSQNGGVSAIMEELPYIRVFVAKYCNMYTMTGPIHKTAGFGFVSFIPFHSFIGFVRLSFS